MASTDLLEELKLTEYYPQKISFTEAIKLRGESQNGCQKQYGLEIIRRLLMFDSTAVVSVTTEINKRFNTRVKKEANSTVTGGVGQPKMRERSEQSRRRLHPMDLLVVVMNCCDDFLRQILVEKMFANQLSIPILLPDVRHDSYTLLFLALKSLISEVGGSGVGSVILTDTLVDLKSPVVSFIRAGDLHKSKSKLVNELLNLRNFETFFHRECRNGSARRTVSNGSIEAAWFQSPTATEEEFNCRFFTVLNLRGDAREYKKQAQFLCQSSTLVFFMVDSFKSFNDIYETARRDFDVSKTRVIVCYISSDGVDETDFELWNDMRGHDEIFAMKNNWSDDEKMSDFDFTNNLRETMFKFFTTENLKANQISTYCRISRSGKNFGFQIDEDKSEYELGKANAEEFIDLVLKQPLHCKPEILPLQGNPWKQIGKLDREQRQKLLTKSQDEYFIADKETEKRQQREIQCRSLIHQNEIALKFSTKFYRLNAPNLLYYLNKCKIKLDARSRVIISNIVDEYKNWKQESHQQQSNARESEAKLSDMELKIANSVIGLEHFLRELGQMYEAVISEEIRMKEELKKAHLTPFAVHNFPSIMASLLLMGQPLELMDGDSSNVPITWLKEVLNQIRIITKNAKAFVLSIIGVQSSGKSTLLNALFGLQFPVSAGRCTKGIYCHLIPIDKESLNMEYDYLLVLDTEGLGASEVAGSSTFRDNELATFAIGLADATIINMKGENWAEMKDILQIVAHGLIRVRKTKERLELMPRCMFVHQNVPAADAEKKNYLGQEKQLMLLNNAIEAAGRKEGFTEITKFDQVIKYDPSSHSWFFPDLWNGRPPKAIISQDYIAKTNELRQHLMQLMNKNPSTLTISGFYLRMYDLWNAMLHNDFVLCFSNTQAMISNAVLNDKISREVDNFKRQCKLELKNVHKSVCSYKSIEIFRVEKETLLSDMRAGIEKHFTIMKSILQHERKVTDICTTLKQKHEISLNAIRFEELRRIENETAKVISVHMRKLENDSDERVIDLKARLVELEKSIDQAEMDKLNEAGITAFEERWLQLIAESKTLVDSRVNRAEVEIKKSILEFALNNFSLDEKVDRMTVSADSGIHCGSCETHFQESFMTPLTFELPQVTHNDIVQNQSVFSRLTMDLVYSKSYVHTANSKFRNALKGWKLLFNNLRGTEIGPNHFKEVIREIGQMLGISSKEASECLVLPPGYRFRRNYSIRLCKFACHYIYNRSLENIEEFISQTDPLADIDSRHLRSVNDFQWKTPNENISVVSERIFDYAKKSFVGELGELIKKAVCKAEHLNSAFMSKRAFLKTVLTGLGQRANDLSKVIKKTETERQKVFEDFMLYVDPSESRAKEDFFLKIVLGLLKEILLKEYAPETDFQKMVENNVGRVMETAKNALKQAEAKCNGRAEEYIRIFKDCMIVTNEIDFRINTLRGFTEAVMQQIDGLYADFLRQANSSFETLVSEDNGAAIRAVFDMVTGCREKCPFCSAPCSQSLHGHTGDHRANHSPTGVSGTINIWGLFSNTQETVDAIGKRRRWSRKLSLDTCQTLVGTRVDFRTKVTVEKYDKWYHRLFNKDYHSFKTYREISEYEKWDIPYSLDHKVSSYWKWFMALFDKELAEHYKALCPKIPESWKEITWEEAKESLFEPDFQSGVEEQYCCK